MKLSLQTWKDGKEEPHKINQRPHTSFGPPIGGLVREIPLFQEALGPSFHVACLLPSDLGYQEGQDIRHGAFN